MALDPTLLDSLPNTLVDLYGVVEIDILQDMARRISTYDYFIPAAQHQMQKLQELGMVQSEIIARLSALTGQTTEELIALLSEASAEAVEDDVEYYTRAEVYEPSKVNTEALHEQLNSGLLQTEQAFKNITRTTANSGGIQFIEALDRAWTQVNTGGFDYNTAIRNAIKDLAEQGLNATNSRKKLVKGAIRYNKTGHVDTLEVAVRRAVVTGLNQATGKIQEKLADDLGVDLVEVTAHGGARPDHAKWQGKCYSRNGRKVIDGVVYEDLREATRYEYGDGLKGWNCHHDFHPYVHGTSRTWTDKEIKALEEKKVTYNGKKLSEYEATQEQRKIEREIRKHKRVVASLEALGEDASAERKKLRDSQKAYTDFTEQTGMKKQSARTQIATAKAEREARKANAQNIPPKPLTNNANSSRMSLNNIEVRKQYINDVSKIADSIDKTLPAEERAKQAYEARNAIRTAARDKMADVELRKELDRKKPNKTFEELVRSKMERKGMTREEAIQDVFKTATKTNTNINKELGLDGE